MYLISKGGTCFRYYLFHKNYVDKANVSFHCLPCPDTGNYKLRSLPEPQLRQLNHRCNLIDTVISRSRGEENKMELEIYTSGVDR